MEKHISASAKKLGDKIRDARQARNWSQSDLAAELDRAGLGKRVANSAVCAWENGVQLPRLRNLQFLSMVLDLPFEELRQLCIDAARSQGTRWNRGKPDDDQAAMSSFLDATDLEIVLNVIKQIGPMALPMVVRMLETRLVTKRQSQSAQTKNGSSGEA